MKSRNGFVSNSSSSSFVIAIKKPKSNKLSDPSSMIDFLIKHSEKSDEDLKLFSKTPKKYNCLLKKEIKELQKDIKWADEQRNILEKIMENHVIVEALDKLNRVYMGNHLRLIRSDEEEDRNLRDNREYESSMKNMLHHESETITFTLNRIRKKIQNLQEIEKKINPYLDGDWQIIGFEESHWGGILESAIKDMVNRKEAIIIEKKQL